MHNKCVLSFYSTTYDKIALLKQEWLARYAPLTVYERSSNKL